MGPEISGEELEIFYQQLDALQKGDILVLAGSIPTVLPSTIYRDIMKRLQKREVMIVVDATKNLLVNVLEYHPFLIKPNNYELGEIFGVTLSTKEDVILYAKNCRKWALQMYWSLWREMGQFLWRKMDPLTKVKHRKVR